MSQYIDGFAFPIAKDRVDDYQPIAEAIAAIWKDHGALAYFEYQGDDMFLEGTSSFVDTLNLAEGETAVFGWVIFDSKETRDKANELVSADPRVEQLMQTDVGFDPSRMVYGGFKALIQT